MTLKAPALFIGHGCALGARQSAESAHVFNRDYEPGISMTSFAYGLPA